MLASVAPAHAEKQSVDCSPTRVRAIMSEFENSTDKTTFRTLQEGSLTFTQGGTAPSCVIVHFSAQIDSDCLLTIRAFLDNTTAALPPEVELTSFLGDVSARSFSFVFPNVAPGSHTLRMQFHILNPGEIAIIKRHNVIVQYVP